MQHGGLFRQIYIFFIAGILVALIFTTWHSSRTFQHFYEQRTFNDLATRAMFAARELSGQYPELQRDSVQLLCEEISTIARARVTVVSVSGAVIADSEKNALSMENHGDRPEISEALRGDPGKSIRLSDTTGRRLKYAAVPVYREGNVVAAVRLSRPMAKIRWGARDISNRIVLAAAVSAAVLGAAAFFFSRRISRPLEDLRRTAVRLADGDLNARVSSSGAAEVGALAEAFNRMAQQLGERLDTIIRQRSDLRAILTSMTEGIIAVDRDERVIQINNAAARMLGVDPDISRGRSIQETVRDHELQQFIRSTISIKGSKQSELILHSNVERHIQVNGSPLAGDDGVTTGGLVVMNDISRLKSLEKVRRDFIANISHEIGTPMTAMKGCVEALASEPPPDHQASERFMRMMVRHMERLKALVEDILRLSRIEYDIEHGTVQLQAGSATDSVRNAAQTFAGHASKKGVKLDIECPDDLTAEINPTLLEQAIGNLIDNAIKYSDPETRVSVIASLNEGRIEIKVRDEGIGIDKKHIERIFERFYRVDPARSRKVGGTGLGLAIVRHIVLAHKGVLSVESIPGQGSTFTISIPSSLA